MKALDAKLAPLLKELLAPTTSEPKRKEIEGDYLALQRGVVNPQTRALLKRIKDLASGVAIPPIPPESWLQCVSDLSAAGWNKSAHVVVLGRATELGRFDLGIVGPVLPNAESVEAWRKSAGISVPALEEQLIEDPGSTYASAGADWLLAHGKPASLTPLLCLFLTRSARPSTLKSWDVALGEFFQKDPKAERLAAAFVATGEEPGSLDALATAARSTARATLAVTKSLALLAARRGVIFPGAAFVRSLFAEIQNTTGKSRRHACAMLAALTGSLLQAESLTATGQEILAAVAAIGDELKSNTRSQELQKETWVVQSLSARESDPGACLTIDGARRWAIIYERVLKENQPTAALEVLGYNLGLREIGTKGQTVAYVPREHDDTEGGLLPGAPVEIVSPGWSFENHPLIRARVRAISLKP